MKYKMTGGTTKPAWHLNRQHATKITLRVLTSRIISTLVNAAKMFDKQRLSQKVADDLFRLWIIHENIPFTVTSHDRFQALLPYLNERNEIPWSPSRIKPRIHTRILLLQPHIAEHMQRVVTHILLSCDG
jgi:hypothetical protein